MEGLFILAATVTFFTVLGILALAFGVDSRTAELNDWARSVAR